MSGRLKEQMRQCLGQTIKNRERQRKFNKGSASVIVMDESKEEGGGTTVPAIRQTDRHSDTKNDIERKLTMKTDSENGQ